MTEAQVVIEEWRRQYNQDRPHSTLGYHTLVTAYGGTSRRGSVVGGLSGPVAEKPTHTLGCDARIDDQPDSEVAEVGAIRVSPSVGRT